VDENTQKLVANVKAIATENRERTAFSGPCSKKKGPSQKNGVIVGRNTPVKSEIVEERPSFVDREGSEGGPLNAKRSHSHCLPRERQVPAGTPMGRNPWGSQLLRRFARERKSPVSGNGEEALVPKGGKVKGSKKRVVFRRGGPAREEIAVGERNIKKRGGTAVRSWGGASFEISGDGPQNVYSMRGEGRHF